MCVRLLVTTRDGAESVRIPQRTWQTRCRRRRLVRLATPCIKVARYKRLLRRSRDQFALLPLLCPLLSLPLSLLHFLFRRDTMIRGRAPAGRANSEEIEEVGNRANPINAIVDLLAYARQTSGRPRFLGPPSRTLAAAGLLFASRESSSPTPIEPPQEVSNLKCKLRRIFGVSRRATRNGREIKT